MKALVWSADDLAHVNDMSRAAMEAKIEADMQTRLGEDGLPLHPGNDYERHLHARWLRLHGYSRQEMAEKLLDVPMPDVDPHRRDRYIFDIILSPIVGFERDTELVRS